MPVAIARIGWMGEKMTLEKLALMVAGGFEGLEQRMDRMEHELRTVKERLSRVEYGVYEIQKDLVAIDEEMRGIHKTIDGINLRVFALESPGGTMPLF
jgi:predicted  nucleic acid-binding Zn-ribbon protein